VYEVFLLVVIAGAVIYLWLGWRSASATLQVTRRNLRERQEERDAWRRNARSLLEGLGEAIDEQFSEWDLTPSEREVALLLLKGHSHMEAAKMTDRSERTVRQHAVSVYRKSGLSGRAELAGFFLGDLILPADAAVDRDEKVSPGS
jgi:DNA-binding NarL/FixJ family response regulator